MITTKHPNQCIDQYATNQIASKSAAGLPQTIIAKEIGVTQATVSRTLAKPEVKALTERLKESLQNKHVHHFIQRVVKEAKTAKQLSDYALGKSDHNPTRYEDVDQIEKFLARQDKTGVSIAKGVGILESNAMSLHIGDEYNATVSPSYQMFLDYQNSQSNGVDQPNIVDITPLDGDTSQ